MTLLAIDSNAKTIKGQKFGVLTGLLYLAPNVQSGVMNTCPTAKLAQCDKACLYSAGRGRFNNVQQGRIRKTVFFYEDPNGFLNELVRDIQRLVNKATKQGVVPMVRLNGTSDIVWERKGFTVDEATRKYMKRNGVELAEHYDNIMQVFPDVQFYDYTKIAGRFMRELPSNYDLTFSYSGVQSYQGQVEMAVKHGARIAVVFRDELPATFMGREVVDGDEHDIRPYNPRLSIVGLKAKGDAKKDTTGFVV